MILFIDSRINYLSSAMDKNRQPKPKSCNFLPQWTLSWGKCKAEVLYRVYMFLKPLPTEKTGQLADNNEFDSIFKILKIELKLKHICHSKPKDVRWIWMTMSGKFDRRLTYLNGSLQIWRLPVTVFWTSRADNSCNQAWSIPDPRYIQIYNRYCICELSSDLFSV